jgi:hypothetical protein
VAESVARLRDELLQNYGKRVEVDYINTSGEPLNSFPLISRVVQMGYSFPIISINGQPRMAGGIDVNQIKNLLQEVMASSKDS